MPRPITIKGAPAWRRHPDDPIPQRLDDLAIRIGPDVAVLREALGGELEIAVAFARDPSDRAGRSHNRKTSAGMGFARGSH